MNATRMTDFGLTAAHIAEQWAALRRETPNLRIREAADRLGVAEARLLATRCGADVVRLDGNWGTFLKSLESIGPAMGLTRNGTCVHEKDGIYRNVEVFTGHVNMGQVLDEGIDLRLFFTHWRSGFAVREETDRGLRRSFQFFAADGSAVHKIYLREASDAKAFDDLVAAFTAADQGIEQAVSAFNAPPVEKPDEEIDLPAFHAAWRDLTDTHEFIRLLRRCGLTRIQALRLAEPEMATRLTPAAFRRSLELAAETQIPIMVFVGNKGCIQIHSGPIRTVRIVGDWLNVLDPGFNLHVRQPDIAQAWLVRKPTVRGIVTGIEFFDETGENVAILHGKRDGSNQESPDWRTLVGQLEPGR